MSEQLTCAWCGGNLANRWIRWVMVGGELRQVHQNGDLCIERLRTELAGVRGELAELQAMKAALEEGKHTPDCWHHEDPELCSCPAWL